MNYLTLVLNLHFAAGPLLQFASDLVTSHPHFHH